MKVHLTPHGLFSRAMLRVANALTLYAPDCVEFVEDRNAADLRIVHVIGRDSLKDTDDRPRVLIQYCHKSAGGSDWPEQWAASHLVWSYYDLVKTTDVAFNFYHAPLGIDPAFAHFKRSECPRDLGIVTSGYVSTWCAEAIEEAAWASLRVGLPSLHVGPGIIEGMTNYPPSWQHSMGISDDQLAAIYGRSRYVSGLRHMEGFEMPVIEGMACGARPIVFDRPETRHWYGDHAVFVEEKSGDELTEALIGILRRFPREVAGVERAKVLQTFDWKTIAAGFWERAL